jgi:branched-chain amino acid aminotransferase
MAFVANINGEIGPAQNASVSILDRGFLYGDSVYEVIRTYRGKLFSLTEHLERLDRSARRLAIDLPSRETLISEANRTIAAAANEESYCRIIVTRGCGPITLDPTTATRPAVIIIVKKFEPYPDWMYEKGIKLHVSSVRRTSPQALDPAIKSGNYLNSVLALGEARQAGFDDALLLDSFGLVTEATSANIFVFKEGCLATPLLETGLLAGVTRSIILKLASRNGIACTERKLTLDDLLGADEIMLTSTLREVMPVVQIGKNSIGGKKPGPVAANLRQLLQSHALEIVSEAGGQSNA